MLKRLLLALPIVLASATSGWFLTRPDTAPGCSAGVPPAWQKAYTAHPTPLGRLRPLRDVRALGKDWVVVDTATLDVYRLSEGGRTTLLFHPPHGTVVIDVETFEHWVLLQLRPGRIVVIDTSTGRTKTLQQVSTPAVFDSLLVSHGTAYWVDRASPADRRATGHRYDVAAGRLTSLGDRLQPPKHPTSGLPRIVDDGAEVAWVVDGREVNYLARFPLPEPVTSGPLPTGPDLPVVTDGTAFAWQLGGTEYWTPGMAAPKAFATGSWVPDQVRGPLVGLHDYRTRLPAILDTRSGAVASIPSYFLPLYGGLTFASAPPDAVYRIVPSELPVLRC